MASTIDYKKIYGQNKPIGILKRSIVAKRIPHALLFTGSAGVQKTETAFAFLKHLKCTHSSPEGPCNGCRNCYLFDNSLHPDVKILEPKRKARRIPIEDVKALIWFVQLKAYIGKYKIGLIKEADRLTKEAANALLKILEDPPKNTIFILITAHKNILLPTILSRCQEINFFPVSSNEVSRFIRDNRLEHLGPEEFLVMISGGRVGLLTQENIEIIQRDRELVQKALKAAVKKDLLQALDISGETLDMLQKYSQHLKDKIKEQSALESYSEKDEDEMNAYIEGRIRERLDTYFHVFLLYLRDIFLTHALKRTFHLKNHDKESFIKKVAGYWKMEDVEKRISLLEETRYRIGAFANQKLTLDNFYLSLISG